MHVIEVRNVNHALYAGIQALNTSGFVVSPRGKRTMEFPTPVSTVYHWPRERVLFSEERDANPFLHFFEALWMLRGRKDLAFMRKLTKNFDQFSHDGETLTGSYGYRWRVKYGFDQITDIVDLLKRDPDSRRAVLAMWDTDDDLGSTHPDIPCNTHVYFKVRHGFLNMMVCNRSNDIILGAYGANVVHMSMLQEYVADKLGLKMGPYTQMSDSFHAYLEGFSGDVYKKVVAGPMKVRDLYLMDEVEPLPMGAGAPIWDKDLAQFFKIIDQDVLPPIGGLGFYTPFFKHVVVPMWRAHNLRDPAELEDCQSTDWARAGTEWLDRRAK